MRARLLPLLALGLLTPVTSAAAPAGTPGQYFLIVGSDNDVITRHGRMAGKAMPTSPASMSTRWCSSIAYV